VDLSEIKNIGSIRIYEPPDHMYSPRDPPDVQWNVRPIMVLFSNEAEHWDGISFSRNGPQIDLKLGKPVRARYMMLRASGKCRLSFDEVEIYPPD
jgi:hypothetical protein